jgi:hypothetical protein
VSELSTEFYALPRPEREAAEQHACTEGQVENFFDLSPGERAIAYERAIIIHDAVQREMARQALVDQEKE